MRGFSFGVISGTAASALLLVVVSQMAPNPASLPVVAVADPQPVAVAPETEAPMADPQPVAVAPESEAPMADPQPVAVAPETEAPMADPQPVAVAPEPKAPTADPAAVPAVAPDPAATPAVPQPPAAAQPGPAPPAMPETEAPTAPAVIAEAAAPTVPATDATAPTSPDATQPAAPATADPALTADLPPPAPEEALLQPGPAPQAEAAPATIAPDANPVGVLVVPVPPLPATLPDAVPAEATAPVAVAEPLPEILPTLPAPALPSPAPPAPAPTPAPALTQAPAQEPVPSIIGDGGASTLTPDTQLPQTPGVKVGLLPKIGTDQTATAAEPLPAADAPPVQRFARPFENPAAKPTFGILLRDTGEPTLDRQSLARLSFPVTFVIDPLSPGASEASAIYRAAGQEVLMLASGIPDGATAADLEQTFQSLGSALPEAVGVIDLAAGGFQANRPLATQVIAILQGQGLGLVTFDTGLNAADQEARRAGLPAATIFRRLDAEAESTATIRRYLDRAAFKAAQEGRVLVVGDTRPETIAAILEWAVEGRAASVAFAPVTALFTTP